MQLLAALLLCSAAVPALAFRSTDFESYTDPDYIGYRPQKVVLLVVSPNMDLRREIEERMTKELEEVGIVVYRQMDLFPPTRQCVSFPVK